MVNSRRSARELALGVLFQVDLGKQPVEEVLEGALAHIRVAIDNAGAQILRETQTALRAPLDAHRDEMSIHSARQLKQAADLATLEVRTLADKLGEILRSLVARRPQIDAEAAEAQANAALAETEAGLRRIAERETSFPQIVDTIIETASERARRLTATFIRNWADAKETAEFLVRLVEGVEARRAEIDERLASLSSGWALDRQPVADRNIMRLSAYEMLYLTDVPTGPSINEAVELAKKYSTAESGRFVNGVLGALANQIDTNPQTDSPVNPKSKI